MYIGVRARGKKINFSGRSQQPKMKKMVFIKRKIGIDFV